MHLTILGIEVNGDNGSLFYTALLILILSLITLFYYRKSLPLIGNKFK